MQSARDARTQAVEQRLKGLTEDSGPAAFVLAARAIAELRTEYQHDGEPDWEGRSPAWQEAIERLYAVAEIPGDGESAARGKLRYHLGRAVGDVRAAYEESVPEQPPLENDRPAVAEQSVRRGGVGGRNWLKDFFTTDGGRARRLRELEDVASCARCNVKLNRFVPRANFAITSATRQGTGYDWYCPTCDRFFEWDQGRQCFVDVTSAWLERWPVHCGGCGSPSLLAEDGPGPGFRCTRCGVLAPVDLVRLRRASEDPLA